MADQAQGLRALANQKRHDFSDAAPPGDSLSGIHHESSHAPAHTDVLNPEGVAPDIAAVVQAPQNLTRADRDFDATSLEMSVAAVDGRLRERRAETAVTVPSPAGRVHPASAATMTRPRVLARVVAVTSGKGGVGKTNFCSNLALTLAARGQRVIIVDADLGLANVHVVMGVAPRFHLEHVMRGEKTLKEVIYQTPSGVGIIGGGSGLADMANLDDARRQRFIAGLSDLDTLADVVLLDTGAGLSHNVLAFLCAVDEVIVVTTPEPTAITDAYATIKVLSQENPDAQQRLVINMAQSEAEAQAVAQRLQSISQRFLQRDLEVLGYIPHDMTVTRAVRAQQPFTVLQPTSPASRAILQIASRLGYDHSPLLRHSSGVGGLLNRMQRFFQQKSSAV